MISLNNFSTMKFIFSFLLLTLFSCNTLHIAENKNRDNTRDIGIDWNYSEKVNPELQGLVDNALANTIKKFNEEGHSFDVHKKETKDKDYLTINFVKGKIAGKGEKIAGYIVSTLGLIVTPVALIAADAGFIAAFYFLPSHKIDALLELSPSLSTDNGNRKRLLLETGALFSKNSIKVEKLVTKFSTGFYNTLVKMDEQISKH